MAIQVGDRIPSVTLKHLTEDGMREITTDEIFGGKTVVMFAVPGAFTPTCSNQHLPGFIAHAAAIRARGVDTIVCAAVNDPFVMRAWSQKVDPAGDILFLPDGNGDLAAALGQTLDARGHGLGTRMRRLALIARDGVVTHLAVEQPGAGVSVSSAEEILAAL